MSRTSGLLVDLECGIPIKWTDDTEEDAWSQLIDILEAPIVTGLMSYIVRRTLHAVVVVFGVLLLVFVVMSLSGDPARLMVPIEAGEEAVERIRRERGFDRPLPVQFTAFMSQALRGDFGESLYYRGQPALRAVVSRFPATIQLAFVTLAWSVPLGSLLGAIAAAKKDSFLSEGTMFVALLGQSLPTFWLGLVLILVFAVQIRLLPSSGYRGPEYLLLPAITLGGFYMARMTRLVRSGLIEVLNQDYIRTARAKGLAEWAVFCRHAIKNAALPVVTIMGLDIGSLLGGAVVTETVFAWPGVGRLVVDSIFRRDFPVVMAAVFLIALVFVGINLVVDILYAWLDPRIRVS